MIVHLAVHFLENLQLSSLIGPIVSVVALVPVSHHPPALESSLLTGYGPLCKLPRWMTKKQNITSAGILTVLKFRQLSDLSYLSVWFVVGWGQWSPPLPEPLAQWASHGSPSLGCSGPAAPLASQSGCECPSGSGSNKMQLPHHTLPTTRAVHDRNMTRTLQRHYLIKCMSYMRVSIGVWGSIMEAELLLGLPLSLPGVQICKSTLLEPTGGEFLTQTQTHTQIQTVCFSQIHVSQS